MRVLGKVLATAPLARKRIKPFPRPIPLARIPQRGAMGTVYSSNNTKNALNRHLPTISEVSDTPISTRSIKFFKKGRF